MRIKHVAIAGCGIAGLALAALLTRRGVRVVLYDRLETPQPLGSGLILQPVGMAVLDALGAGVEMRALGAPITRLYGRTVPSGRAVLDVRYAALGDGARGLGVHRGALFQLLHRAALDAGAVIEPKREIAGHEEHAFVFGDGTRSPRFDLIVDALGARSPLSRRAKAPLPFGALWASLDWAGAFDGAALEQRYERARKMAGVMPIGKLSQKGAPMAALFWSVKHGEVAAWRDASLQAWKDEVLALWPDVAPLLDQISAHEQLVYAAYAHRTLASPLSGRLAHVGDSWHCTSPQLGQGANMALLDALALDHALAAQDDVAVALGEYERLRLWHIRLYQAASWMFTPAYQSDSRALAAFRDYIMAPVSRTWPAPKVLAALVAGRIGAPLSAIARIAP
ncbi:MAG: FAD-dependent oxidoreductase [Hyphomonadaceae bacterium]